VIVLSHGARGYCATARRSVHLLRSHQAVRSLATGPCTSVKPERPPLEIVRQLRVIASQNVKHRGMQVVDVDFILRHIETEFVWCAER
jgi:hypothetical protein